MGIQFTSVSRPKTDEALSAVDTVASEIDGVLQAAGYTLPVTNASALSLLKRYNKFGAAAQAWHSGFTSDDEPPHVRYWRETYENFLARLRRGEQELPGADADEDIAFGIAPAVPRDGYWLTGEEL